MSSDFLFAAGAFLLYVNPIPEAAFVENMTAFEDDAFLSHCFKTYGAGLFIVLELYFHFLRHQH